MKLPVYIILSAALVWFGGAGLAFGFCPQARVPDCPCQHSHGESGCCCEHKAPAKNIPTCSFNPKAVPLCSCNYTRNESSAIAVTVDRSNDPAIIPDSTIATTDLASNANNQTYQALPSFNTPFTPLRI